MIRTNTSSILKFLLLSIFLLSFSYHIFAQDSIPELNKKIIEYVKSTINKKIDRGECWDLLNEALKKVDADWDHRFKYGILLDPKRDVVFPGDMIQFEGVKIRFKRGNIITTETMEHHSAIIYRVIAKDIYEIANQNTGFSGRKVGLSTLDITTIYRGKIYIYRPTKKPE